jgi:hypothetical protein
MNRSLALLVHRLLVLLATCVLLPSIATGQTATPTLVREQPVSSPVVGTWTLTAADVVKTDGTRTQDYGPHPRGLAIFTADGHFSIAVFRAERLKFASNDRLRGTPEEYRDAAVTMSTSFGTYTVDPVKSTITLRIVSAAFPNFDDTTQLREFTLAGDELTWRVPPRPDGSVPISSFKRVR